MAGARFFLASALLLAAIDLGRQLQIVGTPPAPETLVDWRPRSRNEGQYSNLWCHINFTLPYHSLLCEVGPKRTVTWTLDGVPLENVSGLVYSHCERPFVRRSSSRPPVITFTYTSIINITVSPAWHNRKLRCQLTSSPYPIDYEYENVSCNIRVADELLLRPDTTPTNFVPRAVKNVTSLVCPGIEMNNPPCGCKELLPFRASYAAVWPRCSSRAMLAAMSASALRSLWR